MLGFQLWQLGDRTGSALNTSMKDHEDTFDLHSFRPLAKVLS